MDLGVQHDLFKEAQIAQRSVKLTAESGTKIDLPTQTVVKNGLLGVRPDNGKRFYSANWVGHKDLIATAQWEMAGALVAASASPPTTLPGAVRPRLPPCAAVGGEASQKVIRRVPSRKSRPSPDSRREDAADDAEQTAPHTCG